MIEVYCDWPECEHWEVHDEIGGRCTKEVIRMYREGIVINGTIEDPPTCSWYTERKDYDKQVSN